MGRWTIYPSRSCPMSENVLHCFSLGYAMHDICRFIFFGVEDEWFFRERYDNAGSCFTFVRLLMNSDDDGDDIGVSILFSSNLRTNRIEYREIFFT